MLRETATIGSKDLYLFDTRGYIKIPRLIDEETAIACGEELSRLDFRVMPGRGDKKRCDNLFARSAQLASLARELEQRGLVEPFINQPLRLVESYALWRRGDSRFYLHNGNSEEVRYGSNGVAHRNLGLNHTFHDGRLHCMLVKVLVYLSDVLLVEDGPFCYVEGSHKANLPLFRDDFKLADEPELSTTNFPSLHLVPASTGDSIVLNEALLHGTLPKTTDNERIVLAFSFAPAFVCDWQELDPASADLQKLGHY